MGDTALDTLRHIVLVGGGHSHVAVLKRFGMAPLAGARLTLICRDIHTPYSGMLPGYIAGHYRYDEVHIDLARLARFAGAQFVQDEAVALDLAACEVACGSGVRLGYDLVSLNIGSTPHMSSVPGADRHAVPVKPIHQFNERWLDLLARARSRAGERTVYATVGGGAGGVELTLAMQFRLRNEMLALGHDPDLLDFHLFTASDDILPTHNARVRRKFGRVLAERGIHVHRTSAVHRLASGVVETSDWRSVHADEIVWVTGAVGARWLRDTGLTLDARGFILVNDHLQSVSDPRVYAAGDVASMLRHPREKAGVFAVRQGPPLATNLRRSVQGQALHAYRPQRRWLQLISTGDRYAVASRGRVGFEGAWVWRWKDRIDRRFMASYDVTDV
jgi:selenide, water dikinase